MKILKHMSILGGKKSGSKIPSQEFAVIGLGRFGTSLAKSLVQNGHTVLGADRSMELVQRHSHEITQTVQLDSTDEEALKEIDIASYPTVIVAIGQNFEANLMTAVALKSLGVQHVICKATTIMQRDILKRVGADQIVLPEYEAGARLADQLVQPLVVGQMILAPGVRVIEVKVPQHFVGLNLETINPVGRFSLNIVAIQRGDNVLVSPKKGTVLRQDDLLVVIGSSDDVRKFSSQS